MNDAMLTPVIVDVDSTTAISARAKENIRMQAQRYQRGSLSLLKRKSQPDTWVFRYYAQEGGRSVYKKKIVGTVIEFPKRKDAEKAVVQLRVNVNEGAAFAPMNMEQLAAHFERVEVPLKAHSTAEGYKNYLKLHISPKWGQHTISAMKSVEIESWLRNLRRIDGKAASPGTKTKIRNLLSHFFTRTPFDMNGRRETRLLRFEPRQNGCASQTFSPVASSRHLSWSSPSASASWSCWPEVLASAEES